MQSQLKENHPLDLIAELPDDNKALTTPLRQAHNGCDEHRHVATRNLIEVWIDKDAVDNER